MKALFTLTSMWIISRPLLLVTSAANSLLTAYELSSDNAEKAELAIQLSVEYNRMPDKHQQAYDCARIGATAQYAF